MLNINLLIDFKTTKKIQIPYNFLKNNKLLILKIKPTYIKMI